MIVFPELVLTGYPPKDLLLKDSFVNTNLKMIQEIAKETIDTTIIVGFVDKNNGRLFNAATIIRNGEILETYHKQHLPNYDVFDEKRYFCRGEDQCIIEINNKKIGITICEDIWVDGVVRELKSKGAELIINISGSPFHAEKYHEREDLLKERSQSNNIPIVYLNLVGAQDDLIFDGRSYVFNKDGEKCHEAKSFEEDTPTIDLTQISPKVTEKNSLSEVKKALVLGVRDYFHKNGFKKAVIGLSGGIDSALTAAIAVEALGSSNVLGISMPSHFSSAGSISDSEILAKNLDINLSVLPIKEAFSTYLNTLNPLFAETEFNVAEENIQARIRGNLLMAVSNKFGYLVLTTGNKSELSVGYATLYGDMAGGLAVISDVLKTKVYRLSKFINEEKGREIIPVSTITKEPSAELRDNQKDSDSLPPYEVLDPIINLYVECDKSREEIIKEGFEPALVTKVIRMIDRNEYKRQQAALGIKITHRAFGSGRRMPITNNWREL